MAKCSLSWYGRQWFLPSWQIRFWYISSNISRQYKTPTNNSIMSSCCVYFVEVTVILIVKAFYNVHYHIVHVIIVVVIKMLFKQEYVQIFLWNIDRSTVSGVCSGCIAQCWGCFIKNPDYNVFWCVHGTTRSPWLFERSLWPDSWVRRRSLKHWCARQTVYDIIIFCVFCSETVILRTQSMTSSLFVYFAVTLSYWMVSMWVCFW